MLDKHYTPSFVAAALIKAVSLRQPGVIADFAAGRGQLLRHASNKWKNARLIANDIDAHAVGYLRRYRRNWAASQSDFLHPSDRDQLREHLGRIDLVVLNPPFSCRGAAFHRVTYGRLTLRCSTALAFVIQSLPFLTSKGELVAVVPRGSLRSEKDRAAWAVIGTMFDIEQIDEFGRETFPGCAVRSVAVRISASNHPALRSIDGARSHNLTGLTVRRGAIQVHRAVLSPRKSKGSFPFVHSTTLRRNQIQQPFWYRADRSIVAGPAVLLPRVGRPDIRKVATLPSGETVAISDCVFAVCCECDEHAAALMATLIEHEQVLYDAYGGTCAPYLTISSLKAVLAQLAAKISFQQPQIVAEG